MNFDDKLINATLELMTREPHSFGTPSQERISNELVEILRKSQLHVETQKFEAETPTLNLTAGSPQNIKTLKKGQNLLAIAKADLEKPCVVAIGSHYDTKHLPQVDYLGANDSASSSAGLVAILASLAEQQWNQQPCGIMGYWFDGEESQLPNWNDGETIHPSKLVDHTYGSRYAVSQLRTCAPDYCIIINGQPKVLKSLVLMDMIGMKNLRLSKDANAPKELIEKLDIAAKFLNLEDTLGQIPMDIDDDHVPFSDKGIPSINLIDFHNIDTWHQATDTLSTVSQESIKKASRLAAYLSWQLAK